MEKKQIWLSQAAINLNVEVPVLVEILKANGYNVDKSDMKITQEQYDMLADFFQSEHGGKTPLQKKVNNLNSNLNDKSSKSKKGRKRHGTAEDKLSEKYDLYKKNQIIDLDELDDANSESFNKPRNRRSRDAFYKQQNIKLMEGLRELSGIVELLNRKIYEIEQNLYMDPDSNAELEMPNPRAEKDDNPSRNTYYDPYDDPYEDDDDYYYNPFDDGDDMEIEPEGYPDDWDW